MPNLDLECTFSNIITSDQGQSVLGIRVQFSWNPEYFADMPDNQGKYITEKIDYQEPPPFPTFHDPDNPSEPDRPNMDYREPNPARRSLGGGFEDKNYVPLLAIQAPPTTEGEYTVRQKLQYGPRYQVKSTKWTTFAEYRLHYKIFSDSGTWFYKVKREGPTPTIHAKWKYDSSKSIWELVEHSDATEL